MSATPPSARIIDNRYELCERIGEGGMGVVYRAHQVSVDRDVAIKMLHQQAASDPTLGKRFYNEARACSKLEHPNTIRVFDFGETPEGQLYMVMELLTGMTLREALVQSAPLAPERALKILIQCAGSLAEAHGLGIIHRDIKPDNIFLRTVAGTTDFVKVLDFSVAKLLQDADIRTRAGMVFGTPQYMSPEQARAQPLSARSDLYSLGIVGYEMVTGRVPFADANPLVVLRMHATDAVPPLSGAHPAIVQVILRALDKDPAKRFATAGEMKEALEGAAAAIAGSGPIATAARATGAQKTMMAPAPAPAVTAAQRPITGAAPALHPPTAAHEAAASQHTLIAADVTAGMSIAEHGPPPAPFDAGAPQTMLLADSEGVVSFLAAQQGAHQQAPARSSNAVFWILCLGCGVGLGLIAYAAVMLLLG